MKQRRLSILAILSLCLMSLLFASYLGDFGVTVARVVPSGNSVKVEEATVTLDDGRIRLIIFGFTHPQTTVIPGRLRFFFRHRLLLHLRIGWWLLGFDARHSGNAQQTIWLFSVPAWCGIFPCCVAPLLWLRRRRRPPEQRGFAVGALHLRYSPL